MLYSSNDQADGCWDSWRLPGTNMKYISCSAAILLKEVRYDHMQMYHSCFLTFNFTVYQKLIQLYQTIVKICKKNNVASNLISLIQLV